MHSVDNKFSENIHSKPLLFSDAHESEEDHVYDTSIAKLETGFDDPSPSLDGSSGGAPRYVPEPTSRDNYAYHKDATERRYAPQTVLPELANRSPLRTDIASGTYASCIEQDYRGSTRHEAISLHQNTAHVGHHRPDEHAREHHGYAVQGFGRQQFAQVPEEPSAGVHRCDCSSYCSHCRSNRTPGPSDQRPQGLPQIISPSAAGHTLESVHTGAQRHLHVPVVTGQPHYQPHTAEPVQQQQHQLQAPVQVHATPTSSCSRCHGDVTPRQTIVTTQRPTVQPQESFRQPRHQPQFVAYPDVTRHQYRYQRNPQMNQAQASAASASLPAKSDIDMQQLKQKLKPAPKKAEKTEAPNELTNNPLFNKVQKAIKDGCKTIRLYKTSKGFAVQGFEDDESEIYNDAETARAHLPPESVHIGDVPVDYEENIYDFIRSSIIEADNYGIGPEDSISQYVSGGSFATASDVSTRVQSNAPAPDEMYAEATEISNIAREYHGK